MNRVDTKPVDLSSALIPYTSGWVAVDRKNAVVAHAKDFPSICKKVKDLKRIVLVPASGNYFGFVTQVCG